METEDKTKLKGKIKNKTNIKNKVDMLEDIEGEWEVDPETNQMRVNFGGQMKEDGMGKGGLTAVDKAWIANLVVTTVKPINDRLEVIEKDVSEIKDRLDVLEEDMKNVKEDISSLKKDVKAIKECPTIKKELKKDDE